MPPTEAQPNRAPRRQRAHAPCARPPAAWPQPHPCHLPPLDHFAVPWATRRRSAQPAIDVLRTPHLPPFPLLRSLRIPPYGIGRLRSIAAREAQVPETRGGGPLSGPPPRLVGM